MKDFAILKILLSGIIGIIINVFPEAHAVSANIYKTILAIACDSLIKANNKNPDFVILDVRTPSVWKVDHLWESISRNYYDADFSTDQCTAET
jgi:hypothetical protein